MITVENSKENTKQVLQLYNILSEEEKTIEQFREENAEKGRKNFEKQFGDDIFADI